MKAAPRVTVTQSAVRRLLGRYPFGHRADLAQAPADLEPGVVVDVAGPDGRFLGRGYFNAGASTPLRLLSLAREDIDEGFYERRLRAALARRAGRITGTDALRVAHAEADGLPGVVADQFGSVLSVQLRNAGAERHRELILGALRRVTGAESAFERSDTAERGREGLEERVGPLWGTLPERVTFFEDDLAFGFEPFGSQKTGFYLDQRDNRRLMRALVRPGSRLLDAYSYTGGFSLHAARAGAQSVAVDKDPVALGVLERTAREAGLEGRIGLRLGDALEVLAGLAREGRRFDLAVLDPPTLAKRREDVPRAKRLFTEGATQALTMLEPGGHLLVSTCAHYLRVEDLLDAARVAAGEAGCGAEVVAVTYQPADHPFMLAVPESLYLKSILLRTES